MKKLCVALLFVVVLPIGPTAGRLSVHASAADSILVGYAVVTPLVGSAADLQVFQTYGFSQGTTFLQSGLPAPQLTTSALLFVDLSERLSRDLGVAITNPGDTEAGVTFTLRRDDGIQLALKTIFIPPRWQVAQFVTQFLSTQLNLPHELTGTLELTSSTPVSIVALRFRGISFSNETPMRLSAASPVPPLLPGVGGTGGFLLPNFVQGGGWAMQITLINTGSSDMTVRLDLFTPHGDPLGATLNGKTGSTFLNLLIRAGGVLQIAPLDSNGDSPF